MTRLKRPVSPRKRRPASGQLNFDLPVARYASCDLLGQVATQFQSSVGDAIPLSLAPWQVRTLRMETGVAKNGN